MSNRIDKMLKSDAGASGLMVSSLEKAMRVLSAFGEGRPEMGLGELSRATGLDRSAVQRFTATFHAMGYLDKDAETRRFKPGVRFLEFANAYLWSDGVVREAMPRLIDLHQSLRETINFARLDGEDIVYLVRLPSARTSFGATVPGRRVPALNTASGCAMVATLPPALRKEAVDRWRLESFTRETIVDRAAIQDRVDEAARTQCCVTADQLMLNEIGVAVPHTTRDGTAYAVHCSLSGTHWTVERALSEVVPRLRDAVNGLYDLTFEGTR